jgi:hypothetical protein
MLPNRKGKKNKEKIKIKYKEKEKERNKENHESQYHNPTNYTPHYAPALHFITLPLVAPFLDAALILCAKASWSSSCSMCASYARACSSESASSSAHFNT